MMLHRPFPALAALLTAALVATGSVSAQLGPAVPSLINYQGLVTDDNGAPLGSPTPQNYDVLFQIYDAGTGGNVLWGEKQTVTVSQGQFSVLLGNGIPINQGPHDDLGQVFSNTGAANEQVFIGLTVNTVGETSAAELAPRQQLVATPFALRSRTADFASTIADDAVSQSALASNSVTTAKISSGAVTTSKISNGAVGNGQIANFAVTNAKIGSNAVTADKIAANAVGASEIAANAVSASEIATGAVGTDEIADESITAADVPWVTSHSTADGLVLAPAAPTPGSIFGAPPSLLIPPYNGSGTTGNSMPTLELQPSPYLQFLYGNSGAGGFFLLRTQMGIRTPFDFDYGGAFFNTGYFYIRRHITDQGVASLDSGGGWSATSDERLKKDFAPADDLLAKALELEPVRYHFKTEDERAPLHLGFTAQDVGEQFPELVTKGDTWALNYAGLSTVAIGAIKEQHATVVAQGEEIKALKDENAELKKRLDRLEQALLAP